MARAASYISLNELATAKSNHIFSILRSVKVKAELARKYEQRLALWLYTANCKVKTNKVYNGDKVMVLDCSVKIANEINAAHQRSATVVDL